MNEKTEDTPATKATEAIKATEATHVIQAHEDRATIFIGERWNKPPEQRCENTKEEVSISN